MTLRKNFERKGFVKKEGYDKETLENILAILKRDYENISDFSLEEARLTTNAYLRLKALYKSQFGTHYDEQVETNQYVKNG